MVQTDSITLMTTQLLTQTRYSEQTASKDEGTTQFQDLMKQKSGATADDGQKATVKSEKKPDLQQRSEQPEEDPLVGQMAAAEFMVAQTVVTLPEDSQQPVVADVAQMASAAADAPEQPAEQAQTVQQPEMEQPESQTVEVQPQQADEPSVIQAAPQSVETQEPEAQMGQQQDSLVDNSDDSDTAVTVTDTGAGADVSQPVFHDVEDNMVKVGEAAPTEESQQAGDVEQQVTDQLMDGLSQGETTVEVKLSPSSLGNVTVEVTRQQDGTLHIALSAENTHTKVLLEQHTASLQDLVSGQTQRPVQVEVSQRQQEQHSGLQQDGRNSQSGQQQQQQRQPQRQDSEDFLQKLRLGLLPLSVEATE